MASLTNITGKKLISYITSIGYEFERENRGNHRIFVHETKKTLTAKIAHI